MTPSCLVSATGRTELILTEEYGGMFGAKSQRFYFGRVAFGSIWRVAFRGEVEAAEIQM